MTAYFIRILLASLFFIACEGMTQDLEVELPEGGGEHVPWDLMKERPELRCTYLDEEPCEDV